MTTRSTHLALEHLLELTPFARTLPYSGTLAETPLVDFSCSVRRLCFVEKGL